MNKDSLAVNIAKIRALTKMEPPKNRKELRSFLEAVNFCFKSIYKFSACCYPLLNLLRKTEIFCWEEEQINAFNLIKEKLTTALVLSQHGDGFPVEF